MASAQTDFFELQFTPESSVKKTFTVRIPSSVVVGFKKLHGKEKSAIRDSLNACHKRRDEEWQCAMEVSSELILEVVKKFTPLIPGDDDEFVQVITESSSKQNDRSVKDDVLKIIKSSPFRKLNRPCLMPIFNCAARMAIEDDDHDFFKQLGRALEKKQTRFKFPKEPTDLERATVGDWISDNENGPHFCCFTDQALTDFFGLTLSKTTFDAVRKSRQRLQLKQTKRKLIKNVRTQGKVIILG